MNAFPDIQNARASWPVTIPGFPLYRTEQDAPQPLNPLREESVLRAYEAEMAEFARQQQLLVAEVRKCYVIPSENAVFDFLREHRATSDLLLGAFTELNRCFGANSIRQLRVSSDDSGSRTLYAVVLWPGALTKVRAALAQFDDGWWLGRAAQASGYLTFTYELI